MALRFLSRVPLLRPLVLAGLKRWVAHAREPDELIMDGQGRVYMRRWWLKRSDQGNWYLHNMVRPDAVKDPHNHPWPFDTWVLGGGYLDVSYERNQRCHAERVRAGDYRVRAADHMHVIPDVQEGTWTLVRTGSKRPESWGFWDLDRDQFVSWQRYLEENPERA